MHSKERRFVMDQVKIPEDEVRALDHIAPKVQGSRMVYCRTAGPIYSAFDMIPVGGAAPASAGGGA
jgi:hypothetical protein